MAKKINPKKSTVVTEIIKGINYKYPNLFGHPKVEPVEVPHIRIRAALEEKINSACAKFDDRVSRTTDLEEFKWKSLSPIGFIYSQFGRSSRFFRLGYHQYYKLGYLNAVDGYDPYLDEASYHGNKLSDGKMNTDLCYFLVGFFASIVDSYILKFIGSDKNADTKELNKITKLTLILQLYFEKGCNPLKKIQVIALAKKANINEKVLLNRWGQIKRNRYTHNGTPQSVKAFAIAYQYLLNLFNKENPSAFKEVKNGYDQLKENYPDYIE